jgi:hypothetical protein
VFFGEISLLDAAPRSPPLCQTKSRIFGLFQPDLYGLNERNPSLGIKIVLGLSRRCARGCDRPISAPLPLMKRCS